MEQEITTENMTLWDAVRAERDALQTYRSIIADDNLYIAPPTDEWKEYRSTRITKADAKLKQATKATDALLDGCPHPWRYYAGRMMCNDESVEITLHDNLGNMVAWGPPSKMLAIHSHIFEQMGPAGLAMVARALLEEQGVDWESEYHQKKNA